MAEKPAVLIIGGLGYIGRFLALHIQRNNLASEVRIVDKVLPQLAWLAPEFEEACSREKFMQADASKERMSLPICSGAPADHLTDMLLLQNPCPAYSTAQMECNGTMYSIAAARHDTRKKMRSTRCGHSH